MKKNYKKLFKTFWIFALMILLLGSLSNITQAQSNIDIEKSTNGEDADVPPGPSIPIGGTVTWTYVVTNNDDVILTSVTVSDDVIGLIQCPKTELSPGESMTCVTNGIAIAGQYQNLGSVTGTASDNVIVSDQDPSHYFGGGESSIELRKYTNGLDANSPPGPEIQVGDEVVWQYVVTNTGDTSLANIIITDDHGISITCPATILETGDSMICEGTGTAVEGQYENTGTVQAVDLANNTLTDNDTSHYFGVINDSDSDGDGVSNDIDQCADSNTDAIIVIDLCDTGVENQIFDDGCTMSDLIDQCAESPKNHGKYVSCVSKLTNKWKKEGLISGNEKGAVQSCAAEADIP